MTHCSLFVSLSFSHEMMKARVLELNASDERGIEVAIALCDMGSLSLSSCH